MTYLVTTALCFIDKEDIVITRGLIEKACDCAKPGAMCALLKSFRQLFGYDSCD